MNIRSNESLRRLVAVFKGRQVPRVGWPTSVLPPRGVTVKVIEHDLSTTVLVEDGPFSAAARMDLATREVAVGIHQDSTPPLPALRRLALEYIADRNEFDELCGLDVHLPVPTFDEHDPKTWTSMQLFAEVTDSDWYPPTPAERSPAAWAAFYDTAHRFNDRFTLPDDAAIAPHPSPLQDERSSRGQARPDQRGPAAT